jgi:5-methylcytosine-specific restriction protein A
MKFGELVPNPASIMGAKAVFGPISSHVLCFGSRGEPGSRAFYSKSRAAAERAVSQPRVICIGGGRQVRDDLGGHVLNVVRVGYDFGDTGSFVDEAEARRLAQWPVAVVLNEVWVIKGFPQLIADLDMPDRRVLENAMDGIIRHQDRIELLHERLTEWEVFPAPARLPSNFLPAASPALSVNGQQSSTVTLQSEEGRELWKLQKGKETSPALKREAKRLNAECHDGAYTCEACAFGSADSAMFDAHHPVPLAVGIRVTLAEHLIVLCPTCHRKAHRKNGNPLDPFTLSEIIEWVAGGRL